LDATMKGTFADDRNLKVRWFPITMKAKRFLTNYSTQIYVTYKRRTIA